VPVSFAVARVVRLPLCDEHRVKFSLRVPPYYVVGVLSISAANGHFQGMLLHSTGVPSLRAQMALGLQMQNGPPSGIGLPSKRLLTVSVWL